MRSLIAVAAACVLLPACRDAAEPFRPTDRERPLSDSIVRLTYSPADDRAPVWAPGGDSVYFTASYWEVNPLAPATVLALSADGMGSITPLLHNVQEGTGRTNWIAAPALDVENERVAFVHVRPMLGLGPCSFSRRECPRMAAMPMVRLQNADIHVRPIGSVDGLPGDHVLPLSFAGHSIEADSTMPMGIVTISEYHPFQYQFEANRRSFFRPSWKPDGSELVVSDGLRLLRWTPGGAPTPVPGTDDGISPAWSPDGDWIAYTRHERTSSDTFMCEYWVDTPEGVSFISCVERRIVHESVPWIVLVRPDGSEEIVLGEGSDPAWAPGGSGVYASVELGGIDHIVRLSLDDGPDTLVPGTSGGVEPAVSPDGSRVAFARNDPTDAFDTYDIWVVEAP